MSREAIEEAIEVLEDASAEMLMETGDKNYYVEAIAVLRQALETEPFEYWNAVEGWVKIDEVREHFDAVGCGTIYKSAGEGRSPLYTAPCQTCQSLAMAVMNDQTYHEKVIPKREWVGLTDEEIDSVRYKRDWTAHWTDTTFARAIEAKLQEKNGG
jgi:hypothetical protein